jgi:hypothetical protein
MRTAVLQLCRSGSSFDESLTGRVGPSTTAQRIQISRPENQSGAASDPNHPNTHNCYANTMSGGSIEYPSSAAILAAARRNVVSSASFTSSQCRRMTSSPTWIRINHRLLCSSRETSTRSAFIVLGWQILTLLCRASTVH